MRSLFPRYHCADGTSLTIHREDGVLFDFDDEDLNEEDNLIVSQVNEHSISCCNKWSLDNMHHINNVYTVRTSVLIGMVLSHGGCIMTVTEDGLAEMLKKEHEELALDASKKMKKTIAEVYVKPLSKLQRERARACDDVTESHFLSIMYPEYGHAPHSWRYSESEVWVERPWLDKMMSSDGRLKVFQYISKHTIPSSDEEPLLNYDKKIKIPVYRIPMNLLRCFASDVYPRELVDKILDKMNTSFDGEGFNYTLHEVGNNSDPIHVKNISFTIQYDLDSEQTPT